VPDGGRWSFTTNAARLEERLNGETVDILQLAADLGVADHEEGRTLRVAAGRRADGGVHDRAQHVIRDRARLDAAHVPFQH
jgi:hypothetical protein